MRTVSGTRRWKDPKINHSIFNNVPSSRHSALTTFNRSAPARKLFVSIGVALTLLCTTALAEIRVVDDSGQTLALKSPARRIISLSPPITETLYAVGAGERIVATVEYADYPEAAKKIPRVGDSAALDMERIVSLKPDLIVVWLQGTAQKQLDILHTLDIPIFHLEPRKLTDIADALLRLGQLAGTEAQAHKAALDYSTRLDKLRERYSARPPVTLFYQVWGKPLLTINGEQLISDVIRLCGGRNIFSDSRLLVPTVDIEAVVKADPEAIVTTPMGSEEENGLELELWRKFPSLRATAGNNLILIDSKSIGRHSPSVLDGAALLCAKLEAVRERRKP